MQKEQKTGGRRRQLPFPRGDAAPGEGLRRSRQLALREAAG